MASMDVGDQLKNIPVLERTRKARYDLGKSLRQVTPHDSLEIHEVGKKRDAIALLTQDDPNKLTPLLPLRYERMSTSAYGFYRGAAAIMAYDLLGNPCSPLELQICGDAHLLNFGGFATPERRIIFDINDFDETDRGSFEWDLKRLATSFMIAAKDKGFSQKKSEELALGVIETYRSMIHRLSKETVLGSWYLSMDLANLIKASESKEMMKMDMKAIKNAMIHDAHYQFSEMVQRVGERVRIKDQYPLIFHPGPSIHPDFEGAVHRTFSRYMDSLPLERRVLLDRYQIMDSALKVVGIGSVGTLCAMILLMAGEDDPLFLQVKEARPSVFERHRKQPHFETHGERVVFGQKLMQPVYDILLGHFVGESGRHYYVRQLRDIKVRLKVDQYDFKEMVAYGKRCAWALARAHVRSLDPAIMAGYMGKKDTFPRAILAYCVRYMQQNEEDYEKFMEALCEKKIYL